MGMREEFEAWASAEDHDLLKVDSDKYFYSSTQHMWVGWQASRVAIGSDRQEAINELSSIPHIGYLKASQLYDAGVRWVHTK